MGPVLCGLVDVGPLSKYTVGGCTSVESQQVEDSEEAVGDHEDDTGHRNEVLVRVPAYL